MKQNLKSKLFNSKITKEEFFKKYWNKKPYLFKGAIPDAEELGDFDDFFEMSFDPEFETRIVYEKGGEYPWQAKKGPFKKSDFKKNSLWTLMVHSLELFNPDLYNIKEELNFISSWHFDDIMSTISTKGASVGAHIDDYSVFIFQGRGKRKWMLETKPNPAFVPDIDIKLLQKFNPKIEWILEPGDMIYIPPSVAHHGVTLENSISYSIGFKSIRYNSLLETLVTTEEFNLDEKSFHDSKNKPITDTLDIPDSVITDLQNDLIKIIKDKNLIKSLLGQHLTRPKNYVLPPEDLSFEDVKKNLSKQLIQKDIWTKVVSTKENASKTKLIINAKEYVISNKTYKELSAILLAPPSEELIIDKKLLQNKEAVQTIANLILDGAYFFVS